MTLELPADGHVHVWVAPFSARDAVAKRAAGRAALESVVSRYRSDARVVLRPGRRPEVVGAPLHASLARSDGVALVALACAWEVGIDVELVTPVPPPAVTAHLLTEREVRALDEQPAGERDAAFARAWVRKEAALKAVGVGLAVEPSLVEVGVEPGPPRVVTVPGEGDVTVTDLELGGHVAAVAARGPVARVRRFELAPNPVSGSVGGSQNASSRSSAPGVKYLLCQPSSSTRPAHVGAASASAAVASISPFSA